MYLGKILSSMACVVSCATISGDKQVNTAPPENWRLQFYYPPGNNRKAGPFYLKYKMHWRRSAWINPQLLNVFYRFINFSILPFAVERQMIFFFRVLSQNSLWFAWSQHIQTAGETWENLRLDSIPAAIKFLLNQDQPVRKNNNSPGQVDHFNIFAYGAWFPDLSTWSCIQTHWWPWYQTGLKNQGSIQCILQKPVNRVRHRNKFNFKNGGQTLLI